jgi:hypothetical protein
VNFGGQEKTLRCVAARRLQYNASVGITSKHSFRVTVLFLQLEIAPSCHTDVALRTEDEVIAVVVAISWTKGDFHAKSSPLFILNRISAEPRDHR